VAIISLPVFNVPYFEALAHAARLHLASRCDVTARHGKSPYLSLLKLSKQPAPQIFGTIEIEASAGIFDARYKQLTSAFYLQF
jgi:tRNA1(Val) A37 N6-methylase TrmN6